MAKGKEDPPDKWERKIDRLDESISHSGGKSVPMPKPQDMHVLPERSDGGWTVVRGDREGAVLRYATQREAIEKARDIVKGRGGGGEHIVIHNKSGQIRDVIRPRGGDKTTREKRG